MPAPPPEPPADVDVAADADDEVVLLLSSSASRASSSVSSWACAEASVAWADVSVARRPDVDIVASGSPTATLSPTCAATDAIVPLTGKVALAWLTRWTLPVSDSTCSTEPLPTVASR